MTVAEIMEAVKGLKVLELAELVKALVSTLVAPKEEAAAE